MNFATPLAFLLLIPWAVAAWRLYRKGKRTGVLFSATRDLPVRTAGWRVALTHVIPPLFLVGSLLLIVAAARPRSVLTREHKSIQAIAIGMVVDVSGSMEGLDLTPKGASSYQTRLEVVKETFAKFVQKRPDDLIGLVTFGGYASTRSPLTADHAALLHVLKGVEIPSGQYNSQDETMTAIGDGLATAVARLKDAEPKTRIIILLSDGLSNAGIITPEEATDAAAKLGVRVYTIGVGSNGRTPFRVRDAFGREAISYADTQFDEAQLRSIATQTNGRYFSVRDNDGLATALKEIDSLEKTKIDRQVYDRYNDHFVPFLFAGAALILLALSLNIQLIRRVL